MTVSAAQDADAVNVAASITHAVDASRSADEYDGEAVGGVSVTVAYDDVGVSVSLLNWRWPSRAAPPTR